MSQINDELVKSSRDLIESYEYRVEMLEKALLVAIDWDDPDKVMLTNMYVNELWEFEHGGH